MSFKPVIAICAFAKNTTYWAGYNSTNIVLLSIATSQACTCCTTCMVVTGYFSDRCKSGSTLENIHGNIWLYVVVGCISASVVYCNIMRMRSSRLAINSGYFCTVRISHSASPRASFACAIGITRSSSYFVRMLTIIR